MKYNIRTKKRQIDSLLENFSWETMPYRAALEYMKGIEKELMDYYENHRKPLR